MRVFVGFGYNVRDQWIEDQVFPILRCMGFTIMDGKDLHGEMLQPEVESRIRQSDAAIGFFTLRDGQDGAEFNSHLWVRDELVHAHAIGLPIIPVREDGVRVPDGLLGNRQYILLQQNDRLACVAELVGALGRRNMRRLMLDPDNDALRRSILQWRRAGGFAIRYRTQDDQGLESRFMEGRLEMVNQGFFLNVTDVPRRALVEVEGVLNGAVQFGSGWVSADAIQVKVF
jgi:hypothetical protein